LTDRLGARSVLEEIQKNDAGVMKEKVEWRDADYINYSRSTSKTNKQLGSDAVCVTQWGEAVPPYLHI